PRIDAQLGFAEADGVVAIGKRALSNGIATDVFTFCSTERAVERVASQQTTTGALGLGRVAQRRIGVTIDLASIKSGYRDRPRRDAEGLVVRIEGDAVVIRFCALAEDHVIAADIIASSSAQLARHISQRIAEGQVALRDLHTQCGIGFTVDLAHRFSSKLDRPQIDAQLGSNETDVIVAIVQAALSNGVTVNVFTHVTTQFATERVALYQATPRALSFGRVAQRRIGVTIDLALIMGCYRDRARRDAEGLVVCIEGDAVVTRFRALAEKHVIAANIS